MKKWLITIILIIEILFGVFCFKTDVVIMNVYSVYDDIRELNYQGDIYIVKDDTIPYDTTLLVVLSKKGDILIYKVL